VSDANVFRTRLIATVLGEQEILRPTVLNDRLGAWRRADRQLKDLSG
jgi:hypothetical protein